MVSMRALMDRVRNCAELAEASTGSERTQHLISLALAWDELCKWLEQHRKETAPL
jgi:hypothetical protein